MANNFIPGVGSLISGAPATNPIVWNAGQSVVLGVREHNLDEIVQLFDVSNTNHGGKTARIAGRQDYQGTVTAHLDLDSAPWLVGLGVRAGSQGIFGAVYSGSLNFIWSVPMVIERVHYQMRIDDAIQYSFDVKMSVLAAKAANPLTSALALPVKPDGLPA